MPFTFVNNLVIIPITINNQITLKFILDTGANNIILTEKIFGDIMGLDYDRTISIAGPGSVDEVSAYVVNGVGLRLPKGIRGRYLSMLVLEQDYIQLKENLGEDVYGIIGFDVFSRFVVEINFTKLEVTFHRPETFKPPRFYKSIDMTVERSKPYINVVVQQKGEMDTLKLMIDTGASHAMLLDLSKSDVLTLPDSTIDTTLGQGIGGEILGSIGRFERVKMGNFDLRNVLVSIPFEGEYSNVIKRGSRNGTIGGHALLHFNCIIDYPHRKFYLKRNNNYRSPFQYDMSGLKISYLENPKRYEVTSVMERSPAYDAGILPGDEILFINGKDIENSKLGDINGLLRSKSRRHIRATILRDGKKMTFKFRLRKMI